MFKCPINMALKQEEEEEEWEKEQQQQSSVYSVYLLCWSLSPFRGGIGVDKIAACYGQWGRLWGAMWYWGKSKSPGPVLTKSIEAKIDPFISQNIIFTIYMQKRFRGSVYNVTKQKWQLVNFLFIPQGCKRRKQYRNPRKVVFNIFPISPVPWATVLIL